MAGYWKRPEETAKVMIDGFFATGDVGHMDEDGYVFITDRLKDMINASGFKIYPRNDRGGDPVCIPAVLECAVVGMPDAYRGQTVKAFIALKPGAALERRGADAIPRRQAVAHRNAQADRIPCFAAQDHRRQDLQEDLIAACARRKSRMTKP